MQCEGAFEQTFERLHSAYRSKNNTDWNVGWLWDLSRIKKNSNMYATETVIWCGEQGVLDRNEAFILRLLSTTQCKVSDVDYIAYDQGWHAYIGGVEVEVEKTNINYDVVKFNIEQIVQVQEVRELWGGTKYTCSKQPHTWIPKTLYGFQNNFCTCLLV